MKARPGSMLLEAVVVCLIALIVIASVVSTLTCSIALIEKSKDSLIIERTKEEVLAGLAADYISAGVALYSEECMVEKISAGSSDIKFYVYRDGFRGRSGSFVLWPREEQQE